MAKALEISSNRTNTIYFLEFQMVYIYFISSFKAVFIICSSYSPSMYLVIVSVTLLAH
jgi:hypothetical protein